MRQKTPGLNECLPDDERFRKLHDLSLDGIALVKSVRDASGAIVDFACEYLNPVAEHLVGRPRAELYGQTLTAVFPGVITNGLLAQLLAVATDGEPRVFEQHYQSDGLDAWYRNMVVRLDDGLAISFSDITVQKQSEVAGKAQAAQIELQGRMLDAVGQAVIATDEIGTILYWNHSAELIYGWGSAEVLGRNVTVLLKLPQDPAIDTAMRATLSTGRSWSGEITASRRDGTRLEVFVTNSVFHDPQGTPLGVIGVSADITQRKRAVLEQAQLLVLSTALAESVTSTQVATAIFTHVHTALGAYTGMVVLLAEDGQTLEILGTFGYPAELTGHQQSLALTQPVPLAEAMHSGLPVWVESPAEFAARYPQLLVLQPQLGAGVAFPLGLPQRMIGALNISFAAPRVFSADDRVYLQMIAQQCTQALDRARIYEAERRAHLAAEEAVRMRDELIGLISHDLRNPLTVILGQTRLIAKQTEHLDDGLGSKLDARLTVIRNMVNQMDGQIDDLLDGARLRAGQTLTLNRQPLDLVALVNESVLMVRPTSTRHKIEFVAPHAPLVCFGDQRRLARIFANLLRNAIIYSPRGGTITVTVTDETDATGAWCVVSVQDTGIGIPLTDVPHVFERFYRGTNVTGKIRGTGLGLASVRHIIEQHDGRVEVMSVEGQGSTFTVRLPLGTETHS